MNPTLPDSHRSPARMIITTPPAGHLPGASPSLSHSTSPNDDTTFTVAPDPAAFHVRKLAAAPSFQLYRVASNGKIRKLELTGKEERFNQAIEHLLAHPDIAAKIAGKTIEKIDFNDLYIYIKGETAPIPFSSDLTTGDENPVSSVRQLCNFHVDKEGKHGGVSWPTRSQGERATVVSNTPYAYERPNNHLKTIQFTKEDEASALSNWIRHPHVKNNLKTLKERHTAIALKESWLAYLEEQKRKAPNKEAKTQIEKIENELNEISDFALRFEMAHPLLSPGMLQAKEAKALELLNNPSKLPLKDGILDRAAHKMKSSWGREEADLNANKAFAKDLALSSFTDHLEYKEASESLDSPMKRDSLQDAFANLAKAVVAAESEPPATKERLIAEALSAPKLKDLFQHAPSSAFRSEMRAHLNQQIDRILATFDAANFTRVPIHSAGRLSSAQIDNFDVRIHAARKAAVETILRDADRIAAENGRIFDRMAPHLTAAQEELKTRAEKWAQKYLDLSEQLANNQIAPDKMTAAELEAEKIQRALREMNDYLIL